MPLRLIRQARRLVTLLAVPLALAAPLAAQAEETFKVGSTPTGIPFTFLDISTQQIQGLMVDIAAALGEEQGFSIEVQQTPFASLIPSLTTGRIDIISAAMLKTEERERTVSFTDPVYAYGEGLVVSADDDTPYASMQDLAGEVVGAQVGTTFYDALVRSGVFKEVRSYDSVNDMFRDVALGRIKAVFADAPIIDYQLAHGAGDRLKRVQSYEPVVSGDVCLVVRKDDEALRERLNQGIATLKANGRLAEIIAQWGLDQSNLDTQPSDG
ncbi:ABC transporter substrate-binding protein [Halotalea alkalilenta]|uniref:ABC transporter substrate-binding protein n=1 Tax=Halotalea alkalilenta TaxID=376489 RepID=UPI000AD07695|nr:ABC transporter substrate-binding protein [Halotalea alkalilenta]